MLSRQERIEIAKKNGYLFELRNLENTEIVINNQKELKKIINWDKNNECLLTPEKNEIKEIEKKLKLSKINYSKDFTIEYKVYFILKNY